MFLRVSLIALVAAMLPAQPASAPPAFEAGDIRVSPHSASVGVRGGYYPAGNRYELHLATLSDLIRIAWSLDDNNRVVGGPAWLDDQWFDVLAKAPEGTTPETAKLMLRTLLADRLGLAVHEDQRPLPAYVLTVGKRVLLKASEATTEGKCQNQPQPAVAGNVRFHAILCGNVTMDAFAKAMPPFASDYFWHVPMVNQTGLQGGWDFSLKWHAQGDLSAAGSEAVSLENAFDKQLGLRLEMKDTPLPVIVVDRANEKPIESTPETIRKLPRTPTEFEVGDIKPSPADEKTNERILPSGEVDLRAETLKELVLYAWDIAGNEGSMDELMIAPKWMDNARFDLIAKATSEKRTDAPPVDEGALRVMIQNLLIARFKIASHYEERPVTAYVLTAAKPKMMKADPAVRTSCKSKPMAAGSKSPLTRNVVCQNVTMARFGWRLRDFATNWVGDHPIVDATGLSGGWNFTLSFSQPWARDVNAGAELADPDGKLSIFEALDKELGLKLETKKSPMQVLVIDHIEQQPTEN
jgi:uncharacterized protein (TIGR03435 family)